MPRAADSMQRLGGRRCPCFFSSLSARCVLACQCMLALRGPSLSSAAHLQLLPMIRPRRHHPRDLRRRRPAKLTGSISLPLCSPNSPRKTLRRRIERTLRSFLQSQSHLLRTRAISDATFSRFISAFALLHVTHRSVCFLLSCAHISGPVPVSSTGKWPSSAQNNVPVCSPCVQVT